MPGALVAAVVAARLGPLTERFGYRVFVVPGALVWAGAYLWYHQMVGLEPAFWSEWLPGQVLSGIGVGATLPLLGSASLAAVPGGRYATASAVTSSARQLGGVLGIAILVVILGEPTPATAVGAFRDGWVLSIVAFVLVAVIAFPLGRLRRADEESDDDVQPAVVHAPAPPESWRAHRMPSAADPTDLSDVPLLTALPAEARHRLERAARLVDVPAGTVLIREGDPPGSAFVVRRGRLEVEVGGRVVRELGAGEVIGEIALLTGEHRSAAVRARRDSTVIEIPRDAFESMLERDPAAARIVLSQVAERLRTAGSPPGPPPPERLGVVSVVGLHDGAGASAVAERARPPDVRAPRGRGAGRRRAGRPRARRARPRPRRAGVRGPARDRRTSAGGTSASGRRMPSCSSRAATHPCPGCPSSSRPPASPSSSSSDRRRRTSSGRPGSRPPTPDS